MYLLTHSAVLRAEQNVSDALFSKTGGKGIMREKRGRFKSRNMYKGPMDRQQGREIGSQEVMGRAGESFGGNIGTTVLKNKIKKIILHNINGYENRKQC